MSRKTLPGNSPLAKLAPIIDNDNLLRVGGRLRHANLEYGRKHPVIIPGKGHIAELIMREAHVAVGHMGKDAILCFVRRKFWITQGTKIAKRVVYNCVICKRYTGKPSTQLMADLPKERVCAGKTAFTHIGVDFFGPFYVHVGRRTEKRYGVVFSCMTTRAIHLEIAHSLNTDSFINALRRFMCRRGNVQHISCDNGTNLVRGCKELRESLQEWNKVKIESFLQQRQISWSFHPPYASHFGGFYERQIRSVRKILWSILSEQRLSLTDESLYTVMCEVESVLNSRPLVPLSSDVTDFDALTPNHLLLFDGGVTLPPGLFHDCNSSLGRKWRQVQYLVDLFWVRWKREYLTTLLERQKWTKVRRSIETGDLVLVVDISLPRNLWPLGRVETVHRDQKGFVRSANVRVSKSKYSKNNDTSCNNIVRPITKLILLRQE